MSALAGLLVEGVEWDDGEVWTVGLEELGGELVGGAGGGAVGDEDGGGAVLR